MAKNEPLPEMYSADAFAREYNRKRCAEYYLRTVFFPAAREAAIRGEIEQVVITIDASSDSMYLDILASILSGLDWMTWCRETHSHPKTVSLVAILPV